MGHPHVRRAMNCPTTSQFLVNDRRLFRNGITNAFLTRGYRLSNVGGVCNRAYKEKGDTDPRSVFESLNFFQRLSH